VLAVQDDDGAAQWPPGASSDRVRECEARFLYMFLSNLRKFEELLLPSALFLSWSGGVRARWEAALLRCRRLLSTLTDHIVAAGFEDSTRIPAAVWLYALKSTKSLDDAQTWISSNSEVWRSWHDSMHRPREPGQRLPPCHVGGRYDTSFGGMTLVELGPWAGRAVTGTFRASDNGQCTGHVSTTPGGVTVLSGTFSVGHQLGKGVVKLRFSANGDSFAGHTTYGDDRLSWTGTRDVSDLARLSVGYSGVRNLGNCCYQIAVLQVCMQVHVRVCVVRQRAGPARVVFMSLCCLHVPASFVVYGCGVPRSAPVPSLSHACLTQALFMSDAFCRDVIAMNIPESMDAAAGPGAITATLQNLFAHMLCSRRAYINPEAFHATLPKDPWGDKKQQDAYQFLLFLWDTLGQSTRRVRCSVVIVAIESSRHVFLAC
jgi:hypothetical protein